MRVLGFCIKWPKLEEPIFTTFRMPRRDKDWEVGEEVQVVLRPRTKGREILGIAVITGKERRRLRDPSDTHFRPYQIPEITREEAIEDGFDSYRSMQEWLFKAHRLGPYSVINKLTLSWREGPCPTHHGRDMSAKQQRT